MKDELMGEGGSGRVSNMQFCVGYPRAKVKKIGCKAKEENNGSNRFRVARGEHYFFRETDGWM